MKQYKHFHRILPAVIPVVILSAWILSGCAARQENNIVMESEAAAEVEEVEISFFGFKADTLNLTAIENSLHEFMEENQGVNVVYEGIKGQTYWDAFEKRYENDDMDDIMMVDHDHMMLLAGEGKLADLSGLGTIDAFQELAKNQFINPDGTVYFLPTCISTQNLYINYDLLKEHGQEIPKNWQEFSAVCDYFVSQGITPIIANNYASLRSLVVAKALYPIYTQGSPDVEIEKFNTGEADLAKALKPGLEMLEEMIARNWFDCEEVPVTTQTQGDLELFVKGDRPFMLTGGWASPRVVDMGAEFAYGVYPYPILEDGSVLCMDVNTCISVNADSAHLEEAKRFVEYLTQPDVIWRYCDSQSSFTPLVDDRLPSDETLTPTQEFFGSGRSVLGSDYNLKLPINEALSEASIQMLNGKSAEDAYNLLEEFFQQ